MKKYKIKQDYTYEGNDWWQWSVWLDAKDEYLDQIESVTYTLHSSFHNPVRKITTRENKFKLESDGWGTFTIYILLELKNKDKIKLEHELELEYPLEELEKTKLNTSLDSESFTTKSDKNLNINQKFNEL
jgi:transcription initiation factor IIF auxiliary subunit